MRWIGRKKHKQVKNEHVEAQHAEARAIEDKHRAESKWLDVADIVSRLDRQVAQNGFGADLRTAMRRRRV